MVFHQKREDKIFKKNQDALKNFYSQFNVLSNTNMSYHISSIKMPKVLLVFFMFYQVPGLPIVTKL